MKQQQQEAAGRKMEAYRQEELELWGQLLFRVQPVREVDTPNPAVCVHLHSEGLDVVRACRRQGKQNNPLAGGKLGRAAAADDAMGEDGMMGDDEIVVVVAG